MSHSSFRSHTFTRRDALRLGAGAAAAGGLSALLAACGAGTPAAPSASAPAASGGAPSLGSLSYQLPWIRNIQWAGEYMADDGGLFAAEGFSAVDLIAGGPNVSPNNVVVAGKALLTMSGCDVTGPAILEGAPLIALGAVRQTNPLCIMSLADAPILEPADLVGKRIGLQATNETTWAAFLQANGIDPAGITIVPAQFDPQPLVAGEVDGWFSFFANEPNSLRVRGLDVETMLLAEHGLPQVSDIIVARRDAVEQQRDAVKAAIRAQILGWKAAIADPEKAVALAVDEYGRDLGLDAAEQSLALEDHFSLIVTDDTRANGLFTITDALVAESIDSIARGGIDIAADELFDLSVIQEIYADDPSLATGL